MNSMYRRLLGVALAMVVSILLVACGGEGNGITNPTPPPTEPPPPPVTLTNVIKMVGGPSNGVTVGYNRILDAVLEWQTDRNPNGLWVRSCLSVDGLPFGQSSMPVECGGQPLSGDNRQGMATFKIGVSAGNGVTETHYILNYLMDGNSMTTSTVLAQERLAVTIFYR